MLSQEKILASGDCCRGHILADTPTVTVLQWNDRDFNKLKLFAYTAIQNQTHVTVYPVCDVSANYTYSNGNVLSGADLDTFGVSMQIKDRFTSATIELRKGIKQ